MTSDSEADDLIKRLHYLQHSDNERVSDALPNSTVDTHNTCRANERRTLLYNIQYNTLLFMITDLKENTAVTLFLCSCSMKITIGSPTVLNVESY